MISPAKRRETSFSLKARKEPGERPTREGRKGAGKTAKPEGARAYRWEAVAEITRTLFLPTRDLREGGLAFSAPIGNLSRRPPNSCDDLSTLRWPLRATFRKAPPTRYSFDFRVADIFHDVFDQTGSCCVLARTWPS